MKTSLFTGYKIVHDSAIYRIQTRFNQLNFYNPLRPFPVAKLNKANHNFIKLKHQVLTPKDIFQIFNVKEEQRNEAMLM